MIEVISAIVVILTIVGLVVGIVFPQSMIGPTLALAIILWPILYKVMKHNKY